MKALVLAGGFPQIALIEELKRRNIYTVLADYYENPVARPYADKFFQKSTLDVEAITEIARNEKVDFLITACTDQALHTVARVSEALGLPCYIDYQTALNVTNKQYMKQVFNEHRIPTAKHVIMGALDEAKLVDLQYPLIVKPVDCNSSKGVKRVENLEELKPAFAKAVEYSRTDTAIVEEFIDGEELSVDVYVEEGTAHVLSVSSLDKIADNDKFVIFRGRYSADVVDKVHDLVQSIAQQIADAFGLVNSPMLIQMITDGRRATMWISVEAMAYSLLVTTIISQIVNAFPNKNLLNYSYFEQIRDMLPTILISVIMGAIAFCVTLLPLGDFVTLVIQVPVGVIVYIACSAITKNESFTYLLSIVKGYIKNSSPKQQ